MIKVIFTMIRREIQEHKLAFIYAPFAVAVVLCFVIASVYFGVTNIQTPEFTFTTEIYDEGFVEGMLSASSETKARVIRAGLIVLGLPILLTVGFGMLAYSLSTFADERKDKSLIFWRSMPVSDLTTVLSKLLFIIVVVPLLVIPNIILLQLVAQISASIFFVTNDIVSFSYVWTGYLITDWFRIIFSLWAQALWSLPIFLWLMFAGTYARRPVIGAAVPLVATIVLERIVFKTNEVWEFIDNRLGFWSRADSFPIASEEIRVVDISDIALMLSTQAFWIGMIASAVLVAGIVYTRSTNNDYTVD
jgi:ABC-2 type transport system permease protein|tara:strand:+ start:1837 stop:2751 length:915 start_codon:yes stop_codon:yes gene_type:complete